ARRPWRLAASGGLPWAGLQLRLMTLAEEGVRKYPAFVRRYSSKKMLHAGFISFRASSTHEAADGNNEKD
ncbi:hypothetical protein, partial [Pseudomonas aeruginosa]|uniref:hypothetical protein n=1 Tax=Pseudomonas aeruginosa TaxID=287 RepID=UPI0024BE8507